MSSVFESLLRRRVLDLHFRSPQCRARLPSQLGAVHLLGARFLELADDLMGRKAFVQMRRIVEARFCPLSGLQVLASVLVRSIHRLSATIFGSTTNPWRLHCCFGFSDGSHGGSRGGVADGCLLPPVLHPGVSSFRSTSRHVDPRQIALVIDLTSLHLPLAQFFEKHQARLRVIVSC